MDNSSIDVLVVGGGPAGSIAARVAARGGADTVLVDKKNRPADSSACGGLVSVGTLEKLDAQGKSVINEIKGVLVHPPRGDEFKLFSSGVKAYVIDRNKLNADLLSRAKESGVRVRPETEIIDREDMKVVIRTTGGEVEQTLEPRVIIGADGPQSDVRRLFGMDQPSELLYAIQAEKNIPFHSRDSVEVFFGRDIAPGFFGWIIPVSDERARLGLATPEGDKLKELFGRLCEKAGTAEPSSYQTGVIPIGIPDHSSGGSVLTVGDAAGQVKPTTGGGLYPISITSPLAGEVALEALSGLEDPATKYYREWMDILGHELGREMLLHRILKVVKDEQLSQLLSLLNRGNISDWVAENGDIDHLYPLAKKMAKNPMVMSTIVKQLPGKFASELKKELL